MRSGYVDRDAFIRWNATPQRKGLLHSTTRTVRGVGSFRFRAGKRGLKAKWLLSLLLLLLLGAARHSERRAVAGVQHMLVVAPGRQN